MILLLLHLYSTIAVGVYMKALLMGHVILKCLVILASTFFFNSNDIF